jgi:tetratricopeptide (TPR) repeat protein
MFSKQECDELIQMVESHFEGKDWSRLPSGQYEVAGFWIRDLPAVHQWFNRMLQERLFPAMMAQFPDFCGVDGADMSDLCVDNAYLFKYTPETGRRTDTHTDSGCLSFTIALNPKEDYKGGGTWFEFLDGDNGIIEMDVGQVTLRPGGVRHCGHAVKRGTRYIIGGFCMNRKKVEHVRMLLQLAHEYSGENDLDKAQEALEAAILLNPRYDGPYSHLSDILTKKGDGDAAKRALTYCLESVNPRSQEVAFTLGSKLLEEGDWAGAKRCLQICLDVDPVDVEAMEAMAQVHAAMDDPSREFEMYQQIISIPDVKADILGRVYCNLGVLSQGKEEELAHFKKALEITPSSFPATYSLGCAHAAREQWDDGIKWFRRAVEIASDGSDDEMKALRTLYTTVAKKMQQENNQRASSPMPSREEMIRVFSEQMGPANFEKITKLGR